MLRSRARPISVESAKVKAAPKKAAPKKRATKTLLQRLTEKEAERDINKAKAKPKKSCGPSFFQPSKFPVFPKTSKRELDSKEEDEEPSEYPGNDHTTGANAFPDTESEKSGKANSPTIAFRGQPKREMHAHAASRESRRLKPGSPATSSAKKKTIQTQVILSTVRTCHHLPSRRKRIRAETRYFSIRFNSENQRRRKRNGSQSRQSDKRAGLGGKQESSKARAALLNHRILRTR